MRRGGHQPPDLAWPYRRQITPEEWERLRTLDESDVRPQGRGRPAVEVLERGVWVACPREAGVVRDAPRRVDRRDYRQRLERNYGNAVVFRELDPGDVSRVLAIGQHRRVRSGHRAYDEETTFARWEARQDPLYVFVHP